MVACQGLYSMLPDEWLRCMNQGRPMDVNCGGALAVKYKDQSLDYISVHQGLVCRLEVT
jgi:hypothetical protein